MLRGIFEHAVSDARVGDAVDRKRLEPSPAEGEDERIIGLENLFVPPMTLDSDLYKAEAIFSCQKTSNYDRHIEDRIVLRIRMERPL